MTDSLPELTTAQVDLRLIGLSPDDAQEYHDLLQASRSHLTEFGDYNHEVDSTPDEIRTYFESPTDENLRYGIRLNERLIGRIDLNPVAPPRYVLGFWLGADARGNGYATKAARALIDFARTQLHATEIYGGVTHGNVRSVAVLKRLGFSQVAKLHTYTRFRLDLYRTDPPTMERTNSQLSVM